MEYSFEENLPYSQEELFKIVAEIENYKDFLPGCKNMEVLSREGNQVKADMQIQYGPFERVVRSNIILTPNEKIEIKATSDDSKHLFSSWKFYKSSETSTLVKFYISLELKNAFANTILSSVKEEISLTIVEAFKEKARQQNSYVGS